MSDDDRSWCEDREAVLTFARVLFDAGYFAADVEPCEAMLGYFEKPWRWTPELRKYQVWVRENPPVIVESGVPAGFFNEVPE